MSDRSQGQIGRAASRNLRRSLAAMAVVTIVAACSSSSKQAAAPTAPVSTKPAAASSASKPAVKASSQSSDTGRPVNVCATLPAASVAAIIGLPITQAQEQDVPGGIYTCDYTSTSGTSGCTLSVTTGRGDMAYDFVLQADSSVAPAHVQQISGLGDKAFSAIDGVHVLFGKTLIAVEGLSSDSASESLIKAMQLKL